MLILITFNLPGEVPYQLLQQLYTSLLSFQMIKNLSKVSDSSFFTFFEGGSVTVLGKHEIQTD